MQFKRKMGFFQNLLCSSSCCSFENICYFLEQYLQEARNKPLFLKEHQFSFELNFERTADKFWKNDIRKTTWPSRRCNEAKRHDKETRQKERKKGKEEEERQRKKRKEEKRRERERKEEGERALECDRKPKKICSVFVLNFWASDVTFGLLARSLEGRFLKRRKREFLSNIRTPCGITETSQRRKENTHTHSHTLLFVCLFVCLFICPSPSFEHLWWFERRRISRL